MNDTKRIRQLSGSRPGREMRWTRTSDQSIRTYAVGAPDDDWSCVATRSGELTVVLDGDMILELGPKKQVVRVRAGEAVMMPRCMTHSLRLERPARIMIVDTRGPLAENGFRHVRRIPTRVVGAFERGWNGSALDAASLREPCEELLWRIERAAPLEIVPIPGSRRAQRIKQMIEERFVSPPSLQELAAATKTNAFYVLRTFKRHFGFTPLQYAQFLRTEHFCWGLIEATTRPTLLRLSRESGFGDYATFERRMRVAFGRTPSTLVIDDAEGTLGPV
jgi:AraC-like DNA-binding protein/mannose-6-phosphate isomerase-like protein (cupin superfamily)